MALFTCLMSRTVSAKEQYFSLTTNQRTAGHDFFSETNGANIYDSELNIMQGHDRHVSTLFSA